MLDTAYICDWYAPYDDSDPVVIVITRRDEASRLVALDECPELWEAFYAAFSDDRQLDPDGCLSDYVHEVVCLEMDVMPIMKSDVHWLRVTMG